nr:hypothetical protein [Streptomyces sp. NRRL F-5126]
MIRTRRGSVIVPGRSDSALSRYGVHLSSADVYAVVDLIPGIRESLVVTAAHPDGDWTPLFVVMEPGLSLTGEVRQAVISAIRTEASPRHVPDAIIEVPALPHTRTGKRPEVPVKRLLEGSRPDQVVDREAIDDIHALEYLARFAPPRTP